MTKILDVRSAAKWISLNFGDRSFDPQVPDNDNDDPPAVRMRVANVLPMSGTGVTADGLWH